MQANSKEVVSNQKGPHEKLEQQVKKYRDNPFLRPIAGHTEQAFAKAQAFIESNPNKLILDACCGTGLSTVNIATSHPEHLVIGVDQSAHRLEKQHNLPSNAILLQADLLDFYRLATKHQWQLDKHFLLYPNPWPKSTHLSRRWHAMPCFPDMIKLGGQFEVRSNWPIYIQECQLALEVYGISSQVQPLEVEQGITAFEEKYRQSGHALWQLQANLE